MTDHGRGATPAATWIDETHGFVSRCPDPSVCASDGECEEGYSYHEWPDPDWGDDDDG